MHPFSLDRSSFIKSTSISALISVSLRSRYVFRSCFATLIITMAMIAHLGTTALSQSKPASPAPKSLVSLKFCIYGDTRDGHDMHRKIVKLMGSQNPEFIIQTGDLTHSGTKAQWKIYDEITTPLRSKIPFYIARGNHDPNGKTYEEHMTASFSSGNKYYYSFDRGNAHFIALSIDEETPYNADSPQYKWLVSDLEKTRTTRPQHLFVYFHVSPYSIGAHGSDLTVRQTLCPLFEKYGVQAVFTGHDHNYYHTKRNGVHYIVTGGGGAPLYPVDPDKGAISGDKYESVNNCVVCEITGKLVAFTALRADGTVLDRFSIITP